jgi:D-arabinose 1-dehydrogenase-like Zn-dependent alcohol dehydrogenase
MSNTTTEEMVLVVYYPPPANAYPFERIADAMAKLEAGRAKGKIVVTMPDINRPPNHSVDGV